MILSQILFAIGIGELIKILVVLAIILIPAIGQLLNKMREGQAKGNPPLPRGRRPAPRGRPEAVGQRPQKSIEDEIGEFLRRATRGRSGEPKPREPEPSPQPEPPRRPPKPAFQPPAAEEPVPVEVVRESPRGGGLAVDRDLVADGTEHAADRMAEHLQETFDHDVTHIGQGSSLGAGSTFGEAVPPGTGIPAAAAAGFAALLADASSVRQAIVLNEILRRPEDRWA